MNLTYKVAGSVATQLSCGGIVSSHFITNFLQNVPVKTYWKSINIWRRYGQKYERLFRYTSRYNNKHSKKERHKFAGLLFIGSPCMFNVVHKNGAVNYLSLAVGLLSNTLLCKLKSEYKTTVKSCNMVMFYTICYI